MFPRFITCSSLVCAVGSDLDVGEVVFAMAVRSVCGHCVWYDEMTECHGVEVASVSRLCLG